VAKTGEGEQLGTAEGAITSRAIHAKYAEDPILDDFWAIELLNPENRARIEASSAAQELEVTAGFDASPVFALGVASLRAAEDEVEHCVARGIDQYVILGAGFDTFALRRSDLVDRIRVYEVDHPDVQALKRSRLLQATREPASVPTFVPVDFEETLLTTELHRSDYDTSRPAVLSCMNTLPYLGEQATVATLKDIHTILAPGSRVVLNYGCDVPLTADQVAFLTRLMEVVSSVGEPTRSRWKPDDFIKMVEDIGFDVVDHATEEDLTTRYFASRKDGLKPGVSGRVLTLERRP
jgi:methyltransferase (TIGR00027 family)